MMTPQCQDPSSAAVFFASAAAKFNSGGADEIALTRCRFGSFVLRHLILFFLLLVEGGGKEALHWSRHA